MLQELAARTGASTWAIASMLFFIVFYAVVAVRVFRTRPEELGTRWPASPSKAMATRRQTARSTTRQA